MRHSKAQYDAIKRQDFIINLQYPVLPHESMPPPETWEMWYGWVSIEHAIKEAFHRNPLTMRWEP